MKDQPLVSIIIPNKDHIEDLKKCLDSIERCSYENYEVLVVENNAVSYRFVLSVKEQLDKAGSRILGVVLNKVDMDGRGYYGHYGRYYGKYYGKYYGRYGDGENETAAEK